MGPGTDEAFGEKLKAVFKYSFHISQTNSPKICQIIFSTPSSTPRNLNGDNFEVQR